MNHFILFPFLMYVHTLYPLFFISCIFFQSFFSRHKYKMLITISAFYPLYPHSYLYQIKHCKYYSHCLKKISKYF